MYIFIGCGHKEEIVNTPQQAILDEKIDATVETLETTADEGYVYDYQVSLEPIPEFIAQMGGEVCGTMHANPGAIQLTYTSFLVGVDEEWKAEYEADYKIVGKYLYETYGKEFKILPLYKGLAYVYFEENSDEIYTVFLLDKGEGKEVTADTRYYEENGKKYGQDLVEVLEENIQEEYVYKLYCENVSPAKILHVNVAIFSEEQPDCIQEQKVAIALYEKMKEIQKEQDDEVFFIAFELMYYPMEYQNVITNQYNSAFLSNITWSDDEKVKKLIEMNEIYASFDFSSLFKDETAFQELVENKEAYFESEYILPYWIE